MDSKNLKFTSLLEYYIVGKTSYMKDPGEEHVKSRFAYFSGEHL
jgi:hypothetical protein